MRTVPDDREISQQVEFWRRSAIDNLATAAAMLKSRRYNFAMFMCQQTIEALLKCAFVKLRRDRPSHIHKLPKLLALTGTNFPSWIDRIILKVDAHYIKARYFEDRFDRTIYNNRNATALINGTKRVVEWFTKELNLKK